MGIILNLGDRTVTVKQKFLTPQTRRRPGRPLPYGVRFVVAHDTGNPGSTAEGNVSFYENTCTIERAEKFLGRELTKDEKDGLYASAHLFVDDQDVVECVPVFVNPEIAFHVRYAPPIDDRMFGYNANDAAIGVELCFGKNERNLHYKRDIDDMKAYQNYVATLAYCLFVNGLKADLHLVDHQTLDPSRKTDPTNALKTMGQTWEGLKEDVRVALTKMAD